MLIAFEGLDQSGKETQAQQLRERLREGGRKVRLMSFPEYGTSIGEECERERDQQNRVNDSYHRQAKQANWVRINGEQSKEEIAEDVFRAVATKLGIRDE